MKVERGEPPKAFAPVVITLETEEEAEELSDTLGKVDTCFDLYEELNRRLITLQGKEGTK